MKSRFAHLKTKNVFRYVFTPDKHNNFVIVPSEWYGHKIEVIVMPLPTTYLKLQPEIRQGWAVAAREMQIAGDDKLLMSDISTGENTDWWTWEE
ncbi:MAG: hypothetical protein LBH32_03085 [Dysgonamonadaceae bacterium]|nr:hypothetical protein [Dysgonamonadaceae bacterium]